MGNAVAAAPGLADFEGDWRLERRIEDALAGETWTFAGQARFAPVDGGFDYTETGTLSGPGGRTMQAERRYLWQAGPGGVDLYFADGAYFHHISAGEARPEAEHLCGEDLYRVAYDFTDWPCWRAVWRVAGPRKDYVLHSSYAR
jgi:hypothetical protein